VSDQDFNFNPPPRREAKKAFEPPPWEQDQFEELARLKEAQRTAAEMEVSSASASQEGTGAAVVTPAASGMVTSVPADAKALQVDDSAGTEIDHRIETMLMGLRSEEPPFGEQVWKVSLASGAVLVGVGLVITLWGVFAMKATAGTGAIGSMGGGILVLFGLGFCGAGAWIAFRTLRQRGVL